MFLAAYSNDLYVLRVINPYENILMKSMQRILRLPFMLKNVDAYLRRETNEKVISFILKILMAMLLCSKD